MHSQVYLAICGAACATVSIVGQPDFGAMVLAASLAMAVLGVPHGGLDHRVGHRLLHSRLPRSWWMAFFPAYLLVAIAFAAGWYCFPRATVIVFFLVSAWHFGREDNYASNLNSEWMPERSIAKHVLATATGGLVIWIPAVTRSDEFNSLLSLITPTADMQVVAQIVFLTQCIAYALLPVACIQMLPRLIDAPKDIARWVPVATALSAVLLPILLSFTLFFCGWHSWQGLRRLRHEESLSRFHFALRIAPLSVIAVMGVSWIGWWFHQAHGVDRIDAATLQIAFIGLSAIAIPHLILHEVYAFSEFSRIRLEAHS